MWLFGRSGGMLRTKTVTFLRIESSLSALLWGILDLRHVFKSKKVLVFGAMEDITNDEYLARS